MLNLIVKKKKHLLRSNNCANLIENKLSLLQKLKKDSNCHSEFISESRNINRLWDPGTSSGWQKRRLL